MALAVCLCVLCVAFSGSILAQAKDLGITMEYETELFDTDSILSLNIKMDEADWEDMLSNSTSEEYRQCDVEINGKTFYRVAIRPKGNTSLTSIASDPTTDRYSFKLKFDHFVEGQTCYGLDKLILNNNYADATNMKEALIYDMYRFLGADASLYNYAKVFVNGEYWGVYLALEAVEDSFLLRNYGVQNGELYKPDSMNIGGFDKGDTDFSDMDFGGFDFGNMPQNGGDFSFSDFGGNIPEGFSPSDFPDKQKKPADNGDNANENGFDFMGGMGGFSMGGSGANLNYTGDDLDSYSTIWQGEVTTTNKADHKRVVTALKSISEGTDLESYMDIDNLLRYMAVHIFSVNEDSLSGMMAHNYYLYESGGKLNIIPWDYNLSLGGMGSGSDATSVVNDPIDNAFSGTRFFDTLMENETYHSEYYAYMSRLVDEYIYGGGFDAFYERVRSQIDELVKTDPTAFFTYDEYLTAVDTLYNVVKLRGESIRGQLDGTIPSTEIEQRNSIALIDASSLDLSVMGSMNMGGGGFGFGGGKPDEADKESTPEVDIALSVTAQASNTPPKNYDVSQLGGNMPEGFNPSQFGGDMPEGFDPSQFGGNMPEGFDPSQFGGNMPEGFDPLQFSENASDTTDKSQADSDFPEDNSGGRPSRDNFPGGQMNGSSKGFSGSSLALWVITLLVLTASILFAVFYRRKPRKR